MIYDVAVIGGGITGASVAHALSRYDVSVVLLEKESDVALGATRANSGIVHAGYDPAPDTLMATLNVRGNVMMPGLCLDLDVLFDPCGSLVVAVGPDEDATVRSLLERGRRNGVPGLEVIDRERLLSMEPNLTTEASSALWAPSAGIVNPWDLCIAMCGVFVRAGGTVLLNSEVTATERAEDVWLLHTASSVIRARRIVNAAGLYSDEVHALTTPADFSIRPARGQYFLLDKSQGSAVRSVIFSCPSADTKGVLIARTVHGNLLVGPTKEPIDDKEDTATTAGGLREIRERALRMVDSIQFRENIANFSGIRANPDRDDFIIRKVGGIPDYYEAAGIKSPGLASAPAIGQYVLELLREGGLELRDKKEFSGDPGFLTRRIVRFNRMSDEERAALIARDPRYGRIVCRCETVTEGEVLDAIRSPLPARTIDAVKRRTAAGLGRCQGGFCGPRIASLLAEELRVPPTGILKDRAGSYVFTGPTKDPFDPEGSAHTAESVTADPGTVEAAKDDLVVPIFEKEAPDAR